MVLTKEQSRQMLEAAKPLMKWINDNCHPHCVVHIDCTDIELFEGIAHERTDEFVHD